MRVKLNAVLNPDNSKKFSNKSLLYRKGIIDKLLMSALIVYFT